MMHDRSLLDVGDWERVQSCETEHGNFQARIRALGTIGENYTEVTRRLRWTIQISNDYLRDLARLEGRSVQFLELSSLGNRGP